MCDLEIYVRGYSRSSEMIPFDRPTSSYSSFIVTMAVSCRPIASEINRDTGPTTQIFHTVFHLTCTITQNLFELLNTVFTNSTVIQRNHARTDNLRTCLRLLLWPGGASHNNKMALYRQCTIDRHFFIFARGPRSLPNARGRIDISQQF